MDRIYLDSAATTYVNNEVLAEMMPVFSSCYGNTSSLHETGRDAIALLDKARSKVAKAIGAKVANEVYFTCGGTEANNWAIRGIAYANRDKGNHIIVSQIEHHSILDACHQLEKEGFVVTYLPVDQYGIVSLSELMHKMTDKTILVSIMMANNEVGTIQHIKAIAQTVKERNIIFHTDAVQALGAVSINVETMGIDAMSISSHKIYGPKGAGALYVKKGIKIQPLIFGGNQESGKRGGTVNLPAVVGFGKAIEIATKNIATYSQKMKMLRDYFTRQVMDKISNVKLNGHPIQRLPSVVNLSFEFIEGESILMMLDLKGIAVSTGSACTSGSLDPSHVLMAMGIPHELSQSAIRFSLSKSITKEDLDYVVQVLKESVEKLRSYSPITKSVLGGKK